MGCFGGDRDKGPTKQSQKWDYITLSDFKATSAWSSIGYAWLWILFISTVVVYAVDTFTAVNLLIFNRWSSQVKPYIPFEYSKWIFTGCILFSWALWGFEWFRAVRVIKAGGVASSYMDPLAVSLQSMRSQGWRRFLVFAELTKSKKGVDLVAFFAYFAFKGAIRIILAEGPRQVINTLTLIAVVKADFVENQSGHSSGISLFWTNLQKMYNADHRQAIIIFSMLYSLIIWVISVICLAVAAILYIAFIWHVIPSQDGGLSSYCRRKIDKRLERIVESKVKAAIEEEERQRRKAEEKGRKKGGKAGDLPAAVGPDGKFGLVRQPTLPQLDSDLEKGNADGFSLQRQDTTTSVSTLPPYASRPPTRNEAMPPLPMGGRPPPLRSATQGSGWTTSSYESDAPLLANAAAAGESVSRPNTAFSRQDSNRRPPFRQDSSASGPPPLNRQDSSFSRAPPMPMGDSAAPGSRAFSPMLRTDFSQGGTASPRPESPYGRGPPGAPPRSESPYGRDRSGSLSRQAAQTPAPRQATQTPSALSRQPTFPSPTGSFSRPLPTSSQGINRPFTPTSATNQSNSYEMKSNPYTTSSDSKPSTGGYVAFSANNANSTNNADSDKPSGYVAFNPNRTASPAPLPAAAPQRSMTSDYFAHQPDASARSLTAPPTDNSRTTIGYSDIVDDYGHGNTPGASSNGSGHTPHGGGTSNWNARF